MSPPDKTPHAKSIGGIAKYLLLTVVLLGFGTLFTLVISSKLDKGQPRDSKSTQQAAAPPTVAPDPATMPSEQPAEQPAAQPSAAASETAAEDSGSLEGREAPAFELKNMQGQTVKLADYRGKVVFLNFWATWCEPCKKELPSMVRLYEKMKGRPFEILAVSLDTSPPPAKAVPDFISRTKIQMGFPILADASDKPISKTLYHTTGVPESFIIGPDGKVIKHAIGSYEWDNPQIVDYFETLLKPAGQAQKG